MSNTLKLRIQLRRDTVANWIKYDPVLLNGEAAVSSDLNQIKIGNGKSKWSELEYISGDELSGFTQAEVGSYPTKQEDGTLKWTKPSEFTQEGIQQEIVTIKNKISNTPTAISINKEILSSENGVVEIPVATAEKCGLVKGSDEIIISNNGTLNINTVDISKLSQKDDLILYGGKAETN